MSYALKVGSPESVLCQVRTCSHTTVKKKRITSQELLYAEEPLAHGLEYTWLP